VIVDEGAPTGERVPGRALIERGGLTETEVLDRRARWGANRLPSRPDPSIVARVGHHLAEPLTALLLVAAVIAVGVLGETVEGLAIGAIVVLNVAIGVIEERRADIDIRALKDLTAPTAIVRRDGTTREIPAEQVVVGDLVEVAAGGRVPADLWLLGSASLAVDEAILTGEAKPAEKQAPPVPAEVPVESPSGHAGLFAGTLVVRGRGLGVVAAVGPASRVGSIAAHLAAPTPPPLVGALAALTRRMSVGAVVLGAALGLVVLARGGSWAEAALAGIAMAIAAVPEGMATIVTSALALGGQRMARQGAIVRRLLAIEGLGSTTVICSDKTGTLTTGRLAVASTVPAHDEMALWEVAVRCTDAIDGIGDPVDLAILDGAATRGVRPPKDRRLAEEPFDAATRTMAVVHHTSRGPRLSTKGAPEVILARCTPSPVRARLEHVAGQLMLEGLRVLAVAAADTDRLDADGLRAEGLIAFHDPLRPSTKGVIEDCHRAGIRVVIVTGDHLVTAQAVAAGAGLPTEPAITGADLDGLASEDRRERLREAAVVARVEPEVKVELVEAHRSAGAIVAVTGDGVNDAPALRRADVGVALAGRGGTDVAREAASVVVTDDDIATVVEAVREGRRIHRNLISVVSYLVTGNLTEVLVVIGLIVLVPELLVPLLPVQLLWVNVVTDGAPALALGVDDPPGDPLARPANQIGHDLLSWSQASTALARALLLAVLVLTTGALVRSWGWAPDEVRSQVLLSLLLTHLVLAYSTRARRFSLEPGWSRSRLLLAAVGGSLVLQIPLFTTGVGDWLGVVPLPGISWALAAGAALLGIGVLDLARTLTEQRRGP
jgi:P-type Ca2+ transporter type 2C